MDLALLFGLASAVAYGTGDYLWQHAGRAVGLWRSQTGLGWAVAAAIAFGGGVVVALSSVTSAITVLLGRMLDGARLAAHQWLAMGAVVAGLLLLRS